jgi:hypothetical protein
MPEADLVESERRRSGEGDEGQKRNGEVYDGDGKGLGSLTRGAHASATRASDTVDPRVVGEGLAAHMAAVNSGAHVDTLTCGPGEQEGFQVSCAGRVLGSPLCTFIFILSLINTLNIYIYI